MRFSSRAGEKKRVWSAVNDRVRVASAEGIVVFALVDLRARRDGDAGRPSGSRKASPGLIETSSSSRPRRRIPPFPRARTFKLTMFSCFSARSTFTSRSVVLRTFASSSDSLNFFTATVSPVCLFRHFSTTPYAPSPTTPRTSYLFIAPPTPRSAARKRKAGFKPHREPANGFVAGLFFSFLAALLNESREKACDG